MAVRLIKESKKRELFDNKFGDESSLNEDVSSKDWEVKQVCFDVAVPKGTDLNVQSFSGNVEFYRAVVNMLDSLGYEMAGDIIDASSDVTDVYRDNDYEFFTECASL